MTTCQIGAFALHESLPCDALLETLVAENMSTNVRVYITTPQRLAIVEDLDDNSVSVLDDMDKSIGAFANMQDALVAIEGYYSKIN